jgi:hypothetical protein
MSLILRLLFLAPGVAFWGSSSLVMNFSILKNCDGKMSTLPDFDERQTSQNRVSNTH